MRMPREKRATSKLQMNLGLLLQAQGKLEDAEVLFRESIEVHRARYGDQHPSTLTSISNLGRLLQDRDKLEDADHAFRHAVDPAGTLR